MAKLIALLLAISCLCASELRANQSKAEAFDGYGDALAAADELVLDGRADEANAKLLAVIPEKTRTPAQTLILGNLLFDSDPKTSYTLHKSAAAALPDEFEAQLRWAMEQHRAGECAGAAETYEKAAKAEPKLAPLFYGLWAECLIRTGKITAAVKMWDQSEKAVNGSLEEFESWVCRVNMHSNVEMDRTALMKKTRGGDIEAAAKLIQLDANFPWNWWDNGPNEKFLARDIEVLRATKFADTARLPELLCAAECGIALAKVNGDAEAILKRYGFLFDPAMTLPADGWAMSTMLAFAIDREVVTNDQAREKWGQAVLARAENSTDAEYFHVAANLYVGTDKRAGIDQMGWDETGDVRFAASILAGMESQGKLKAGNAVLARALRQFPEDSVIEAFAVRTTAAAKLPMHDVLVHAIKAEYSKFSPQGGLSERRSAAALEGYFKQLAAE